MRCLSLFAGVGMFDYAWRKLGWETAAFVEIDPWCQRVLSKHWPGVKQYEDACDVTAERLIQDGIMADTEGANVAQGGTEGGRPPIEYRRSGGRSELRHDTKTPIQPAGTGTGCASARAEQSDVADTEINGRRVDVITGGFPCQDLSVAGKQKGIDGERSGLWSEFARIIGEVRPRYVIVENVAALLSGDRGRWMGRVLGDLAEIGYDCEWHCIPAGNPDGLSAGAPHRRERVWIICYPAYSERSAQEGQDAITRGTGGAVARPQGEQRDGVNDNARDSAQRKAFSESGNRGGSEDVPHPRHPDVANSECKGLEGQSGRVDVWSDQPGRQPQEQNGPVSPEDIRPGQRDEGTGQSQPGLGLLAHGIATELSRSRWLAEPRIGRVAAGVPDRVNKLKALGNGLVWQIPFAIGRALMERES